MSEHTTIYALIDPRTDDVRYIGQTVDLPNREQSHLTCKKVPDNPRLMQWLQELRDSNLKPETKVIGTVESQDSLMRLHMAGACEKRIIKWYSHYNRHYEKKPLLNIAGNPDYKRTRKGYHLRPHVIVD